MPCCCNRDGAAKGGARDPAACDAQKVRQCHGDVEKHPCEASGCERPADHPEKCSPEQTEECHGDEKSPCNPKS